VLAYHLLSKDSRGEIRSINFYSLRPLRPVKPGNYLFSLHFNLKKNIFQFTNEKFQSPFLTISQLNVKSNLRSNMKLDLKDFLEIVRGKFMGDILGWEKLLKRN
jgi:hypothetical protein